MIRIYFAVALLAVRVHLVARERRAYVGMHWAVTA